MISESVIIFVELTAGSQLGINWAIRSPAVTVTQVVQSVESLHIPAVSFCGNKVLPSIFGRNRRNSSWLKAVCHVYCTPDVSVVLQTSGYEIGMQLE
jgi:hypothetical protein